MANILINLWDRVTIYCTNHEEPVKMEIFQNLEKVKSPFFVCTARDECHCPNRLNFDDYQGLVLKFFEYINNDFPTMDFTNFTFDYKGARQKVSVKVLKYTDNEIRLGIINRTILGN